MDQYRQEVQQIRRWYFLHLLLQSCKLSCALSSWRLWKWGCNRRQLPSEKQSLIPHRTGTARRFFYSHHAWEMWILEGEKKRMQQQDSKIGNVWREVWSQIPACHLTHCGEKKGIGLWTRSRLRVEAANYSSSRQRAQDRFAASAFRCRTSFQNIYHLWYVSTCIIYLLFH